MRRFDFGRCLETGSFLKPNAMQTKELVKPKEGKAADTPKTRYFKTLFSSSITDSHGEWFTANTLGEFVDQNFVESGIYKKISKNNVDWQNG